MASKKFADTDRKAQAASLPTSRKPCVVARSASRTVWRISSCGARGDSVAGLVGSVGCRRHFLHLWNLPRGFGGALRLGNACRFNSRSPMLHRRRRGRRCPDR
jgi:hypothetical protein